MSGPFFTAYRYRRGVWVSKPSGTNLAVIGKSACEAICRARALFPPKLWDEPTRSNRNVGIEQTNPGNPLHW